jgi:CubicO group peptidase (beta-lactamase class C family)
MKKDQVGVVITLCLVVSAALAWAAGSLPGLLAAQPVWSAGGGPADSETLALRPINPADSSPADLDDLPALESFLDGFFDAALAAHHIPGAVITIVKDGQLHFSKGYGYADIERGVMVDPERTLFRPGSVSKLFVWTSVMQLEERGLLALEDDIRPNINVRLPASCREPITLEHLMSHTPGFEDTTLGLFVRTPADRVPLEDYLRMFPPECIFPPGQVPAYSNYGTALAGYLVERAAGMSFDAYVEENIFKPLQMTSSTFRQPVPAALADDLAIGYGYVGGSYIPGDFEVANPYPVGSLSGTANDMAHFMIAHLQEGRFGEERILREATARRMHTQHFTFDSRASGWAHGFIELEINGIRMISHGGDTFLFHTLLVLAKEKNFGMFVSFNAAGGTAARSELLQAFMNRYFPPDSAGLRRPLADSRDRLVEIAGEYHASRLNGSTLEKLLRLMQPVVLSISPDGYLNLNIANAMQSQWVEVEPYVFQERLGSERIYFQLDEKGRVTTFVMQNNPTLVAMRTPWYATIGFTLFLIINAVLMGISALLFWPVISYVTRAHEKEHPPQVRIYPRLARWVAYLFNALFFIFLIGFMSALGNMNPAYQVPDLILGPPAWLGALLWLPKLMAALAFGMVIFLVLAWTGGGDALDRPYWGLAGRIHYTLVVLAGVGIIWFCYYWNLL